MSEPIYLIVPMTSRNTLEEARQYCLDNFESYNGEYVETICLNCGSVCFDATGNTLTAEFVGECSACFEMRKLFPEQVLT